MKVLSTDDVSEVPDLIAQAEAEQKAGRYVAGYLAYEAGAAFGLPTKTLRGPGATHPQSAAGGLPLAYMAVYEPEAATLLPPTAPSLRPSPPEAEKAAAVALSLNETQEQYTAAIAKVHRYIAAGDIRQVNYTVRARFTLQTDPKDYFLSRSAGHPVPYAAFLDLGEVQVISLSPELFLRRRGARLETRPMKGTRPRGADTLTDVALGYELIGSAKDRAENLVVVEVARAEFERLCRPGTVRTSPSPAVEPYGTVWQMTSTVTGEIAPETSLVDILTVTFPGASVTGVPKPRSMKIIRDLESEPRGVYTGSLFLLLPGGDFTANVAIRTIIHRDGDHLLGTGSGVMEDSDAAEEYAEVRAKTAFVLRDHFRTAPPSPAERRHPPTLEATGLFETMLLRAQRESASAPSADAVLERYLWLDDHLDRLARSAAEGDLPFDRQKALGLLAGPAQSSEAVVVRLDLDRSGDLRLTTRPVPSAPPGPVRLLLSPFRVDPGDPSLGHKVNARPLFDREHARATEAGYFDALFCNLRDHITEGAVTNLFARFGTRWTTPPLHDGLLPGIWRRHFMTQVGAVERPLTLADLAAADEMLVGNSVRGPISVSEVVERPW